MKFRFIAVAVVLSFSACGTPGVEAAPTVTADSTARASSQLLMAAAAGDVKLLQSSLKRGAQIEIRDGKYLLTPLGWAAWRGQTKAVNALLAAGANTEAQSMGGSALPTVMDLGILGLQTLSEPSDQTPLALAVIGNSPQAPQIVEILLKHGANPNARTVRGNTPLFYASMRSKPAVVDALLASGAEPNLRGEEGRFSTLAGAVVHLGGEDPALIQKLLKAGANPNDTFFNNSLTGFARAIKRTRSAELIEAGQKAKLQRQIREAKKPALVLPETNAVPTILE